MAETESPEYAGLLRKTARTAFYLSEVLRIRQYAALAESLLRSAFSTDRNATLRPFAYFLGVNGRWDEAEPLFREAIALSEATLESYKGEPERLGELASVKRGMRRARVHGTLLFEFACGLRDNGAWVDAEPLFRSALDWFGSDEEAMPFAPRLDAQRELARLLLAQGRCAEAEPLVRSVLGRETAWPTLDAMACEFWEACATVPVLEEWNPSPATYLVRLSRDLVLLERRADAERVLRQCLLTSIDAHTRAIVALCLGRTLRARGEWSAGEPFLREALRHLAPNSELRKDVLIGFARALTDDGRAAEAEQMVCEAINALANGSTPESADALRRFLSNENRLATDAEMIMKLFGLG